MSSEDRVTNLEENSKLLLLPSPDHSKKPKRCCFCHKYDFKNTVTKQWTSWNGQSWEFVDMIPSCETIPWAIASALVQEFFRKNGIEQCNHDKLVLTDYSLKLVNSIEEYLKFYSNSKYHPYRLFEVLYYTIDNKKTPTILKHILRTVGKKWIFKQNPEDYNIRDYIKTYAEHGKNLEEGKSSPSGHEAVYRTLKEWAEVCKCDVCQKYYTTIAEEEKRILSCLEFPVNS